MLEVSPTIPHIIIYITRVTSELCLYVHPPSVLKKPKNGALPEKSGATGLKFGMQTQPDGVSPTGHTYSSLCIR